MMKNPSDSAFVKKNGNITDFFKPFARASIPLKRSIPQDTTHEGQPSPLKSPKLNSAGFRPHTSELSSSGISTLTPISSDGSAEPPSQTLPDLPRVLSKPSQSASSSFGQSTAPSSQRVIKNGETIIRNSDDESDSDSSLADIDEILRPRKRRKSSSPLTELGSSEPEFPMTALLPTKKPSRTSRRLRDSTRRDALADKKYKFSLNNLLERTERDNAEDEAYQRALDVANEVIARQMPADSSLDFGQPSKLLTAEALASKIKVEDPDDVDKLMQALKRTEALQINSTWSFFGDSDLMSEVNVPPLPRLANFPWSSWARQSASQEIAFLSGTAADIAAAGNLPREILTWILEYIYFESREDLFLAYLLVAEKAGSQIEGILDTPRLISIMSSLGMSTEAAEPSKKIQPSNSRLLKSSQQTLRKQMLENFLLMARRISPFLSNKPPLLYILLCMCYDSSIVADAKHLFALQDAIASCIDEESHDSLLADPHITEGIFAKTDDVHLQLQLIKTIPTNSAPCCDFRRRLALAFFYDEADYLKEPTPLLPLLSEIADHVRGPLYTVRNNMDFQQLGAKMSLLDIGIDDGDRPYGSLNVEVEKKFNKQVDELSAAIREKFTRIVDSGASHMSRTEAKEVMVALEARLQYAVRTKPKPRKSIFGNIESVQSKDLMRKHFKVKQKEQV